MITSRTAARITARVLAVTAALALALLAAPAAVASTAPRAKAMPQEELDALVTPSIVFIYGTFSGEVHFTDPKTGQTGYSSALTTNYWCTGFAVANEDGEATIMTAGHCADPTEAKQPLIELFLQQQVSRGNISASQESEYLQYGMTNWSIVGSAVDTSVNQQVDVYEPAAASGLRTSTKMVATVEGFKSFTSGDVALLQVHTEQPLPVLEVGPEPNTGDALTAVGYPSAVQDISDSTLTPSFETGHMNSLQTRNGLPEIQFDAGLSPGMSGGPVVNDQGQVIGINSYRNSGETQQFNFAVDTSTVKGYLQSNSVHNTLGAADRAFRTGLADYFAGNYRQAIPKFNKALNTEPANALAQKYKSLSATKAPSEPVAKKPSSGSSTGMILGIVVGAIIVIGAVLLLVLRRRRATPNASAGAVPYGPPGGGPGPYPAPYPGAIGPQGAQQFAPTELTQPPTTLPPTTLPATTLPATALPATPYAPTQQLPEQPLEASFGQPSPGAETAAATVAPPRPAEQETVYCPNCGTGYPTGTRFCSKDGALITG